MKKNNIQSVFERVNTLSIEVGGQNFDHSILFPLITKSDLRYHYGLRDNRALRSKILTDEVLLACKIDLEKYKAVSGFTLIESFRIKKELNLEWIKVPRK